MTRHRNISVTAIAALLACSGLWAVQTAGAERGWLENLQQARNLAKRSGRPILANFTGSDWCPPCMKLKSEVFSSEEFQSWAAENVILLEVDFPRNKGQRPDLKRQNQALKEHFKINGYPTVLLMTEGGEDLGRTVGFRPLDKFMPLVQEMAAKAPKPESEEEEKDPDAG